MEIDQVLKKHKRVLFLFSGGKDSTAALYHLKPYWDRLVVGWINTGDLCPEIVEFIQGISKQVPNFVTVHSDSQKWREENGWPSPVLPVDYCGLGQYVNGPKPIKISAYLDCCKANIWDQIKPLVEHTKATAVLTGQKDCDHAKDPRENGVWIGGAQYFYPIHDWSEDDVRNYLKEIGITDPRFYTDDTSIDCRTCTGYPQYKARTAYIKEHHPEHYTEVKRRWNLIKAAVEEVTNEI
jgi:3'-phosphoadenosine 5'-phosphosulfate sulfotransferase (PAPS reductase)/FAD synthetase